MYSTIFVREWISVRISLGSEFIFVPLLCLPTHISLCPNLWLCSPSLIDAYLMRCRSGESRTITFYLITRTANPHPESLPHELQSMQALKHRFSFDSSARHQRGADIDIVSYRSICFSLDIASFPPLRKRKHSRFIPFCTSHKSQTVSLITYNGLHSIRIRT